MAPQQQQQVVHTTETSSPTSSHTDYQPASTSSAAPSNLRQLAVQPQLSESAESTQREDPENVESLNVAQPQQQPQQQVCQPQQQQQQQQVQQQQQQHQEPQPQTVALVSPRVETQNQQQQQQQVVASDQQQTVASSSTQSVSTSQVSTGHKRPRSLEPTASGSADTEAPEHSRAELETSPNAKRSRTQELASNATISGSDVEYQVSFSIVESIYHYFLT